MRSERPDVARTPFVVAGGRYAIGPRASVSWICVCVASRHVEGGARGHGGQSAPRRVRIVSLIDMHMVRRPLLRCVQHVETPPTPTARTDGGDRRGERRPRARRPRKSGTRRSAAPPKHQTPAPWRPGQIPLSIAPPSLSRSARTTRMRNTVPQKHSRWVTSLHAPRHTRRTCEPRVSPTPRENIPAPPHRAPHLVLAPAHPRRPLST